MIPEPPKLSVLNVLKLMENILLTLKGVKFWLVFKFFLVRRKLPFFGQNCSLPFSLRSLDIPALLKSWQKHYHWHCMLKKIAEIHTPKENIYHVKQNKCYNPSFKYLHEINNFNYITMKKIKEQILENKVNMNLSASNKHISWNLV
jgi:hypothetical protein